MRLAPDADILGIIQRAGEAKYLVKLGILPVIILDAVWDEMTIDALQEGADPQTVQETTTFLTSVAGAPTQIVAQSPEAQTLSQLMTPPTTEGTGELSIIAYAIHNPDVTPVLLDRRALRSAVEELRGRVFSMHGFLDILRSQHQLPTAFANRISQYLCASQRPIRPPLWW